MEVADREAVLNIGAALAPLDALAFEPVLQAMQVRTCAAGERLLVAGEPDPPEFFVLEGVLKSWVGDAEGRAVTLAFHCGPGVAAPAVSRSMDGRSSVHVEALTAARVAAFAPQVLVQRMLADPVIQRWGDAVLQAELARRARREWALAALPAAERLRQFRQEHVGLEDRIAHHHIASYLGMTPVTMSRARAQSRLLP